jgi:hypothetical protein
MNSHHQPSATFTPLSKFATQIRILLTAARQLRSQHEQTQLLSALDDATLDDIGFSRPCNIFAGSSLSVSSPSVLAARYLFRLNL